MGDVLTFTPRPKPVALEAVRPLAGADLRASLEEAAQTALDAADRMIAVLDRMDGDADHEDGGDAEPSLASPENATGSQIVWMRSGDQDCEADTPEIMSSEGRIKDVPDPFALPRNGHGNVVAACSSALLSLIGI
jgi:hypothetical protein